MARGGRIPFERALPPGPRSGHADARDRARTGRRAASRSGRTPRHSHDRDTWNLRSFHVNGVLRQDDAGWWFVPARLIPGTGLTGFRGNIAWLRGSSREARDYLRTRGLAKPRIDWAEIDAAKKEGAALERARRARE